MGKALQAITKSGRAAWNVAKAIGPFILSQSTTASEAWADHKLRLARVDAMKELMIEQARIVASVQKAAIDRYVAAAPEERFRLRQEMEATSQELRRLNIYGKALGHLEEATADAETQATEPAETPSKEIAAHWMDKFNEFAKLANEPWREDLLARALALEAQQPDSIGPRSLWFIGTVDEHVFHALASLLDISFIIDNILCLPLVKRFYARDVPNCQLETGRLGTLLFLVGDSGLYGDFFTSASIIPAGQHCVRYSKSAYVISAEEQLKIPGAVLTHLGKTIAKLYERQANELGTEIFQSWLDGLDNQKFKVSPQ